MRQGEAVAIVYHDNCMDGAAAAWAAAYWLTGARSTRFFAAKPGTMPDAKTMVGTDRIIVVDMCPPEEWLADPRVHVFDHHKTSRDLLSSHARSVHDESVSGCVLAWERCAEDVTDTGPAPELLYYIQDRDLWRWELPGSKAVSASIFCEAPTPQYIQSLIDGWDLMRHVARGNAILEFQDRLVAQACRNALPVTLQGSFFMAVNSPVLHSEIGNELVERFGRVAMVWSVVPEGTRVSLRSSDKHADVSIVAKMCGGGGHRNAAGFTMPVGWTP